MGCDNTNGDAIVAALRVRDVMEMRVTTIVPGTPLPEIIRTFHRADVHQLPVLDTGVVVGMVTRESLPFAVPSCVPALQPYDRPTDPYSLSAADLMTQPVVTIGSNATVLAAARMLLAHTTHALAVIRRRQLVGILTATDILRLIVRVHGVLPEPTSSESGP